MTFCVQLIVLVKPLVLPIGIHYSPGFFSIIPLKFNSRHALASCERTFSMRIGSAPEMSLFLLVLSNMIVIEIVMATGGTVMGTDVNPVLHIAKL